MKRKHHRLHLTALKLLMKGCRLSHPQFEKETGSWRLAAYINMLRNKGILIETCKIRKGGMCEYKISKEEISRIKASKEWEAIL